MSNTQQHEVSTLPQIKHGDNTVLTTELVARYFGCEDASIRKALSRNQNRFEIGKHYFLLDGVELKSFKNQYLNTTECLSGTLSIVGKNANSLTLWTERGVALLAKIVDTDQAWGIIDTLVDFYFNREKKSTIPQTLSQALRAYAIDVVNEINTIDLIVGGNEKFLK